MLLYNYYSKISATFSPAGLTPQNFRTQAVHDNIALAHLVYKCLVKIGVWLWGKLDKLNPVEVGENLPWVSLLSSENWHQNHILLGRRIGAKLCKPSQVSMGIKEKYHATICCEQISTGRLYKKINIGTYQTYSSLWKAIPSLAAALC